MKLYKIKKSDIDKKGRGLYATRDIKEGTKIIDYIGKLITKKQTEDSDKYDNKVQIDPVEAEENEEQQQTMTQQGDSLKKTEMSNPTQNTKIPSSPATKSPAVNENYTSQYMPING